MLERRLVDKAYSRLLRLYPQPFRERFGAEMEQNFADMSREREVRNELKLLRVVWLFGEVIVQAGRENLAEFRQRNVMREFLASKRFAGLIGALTILPGVLTMTLLFLGIEPPLGPFREMLATPPDGGPSVLGIAPLIAIGIIVALPVAGIVVTGALRKDGKLPTDLILASVIGIVGILPFIALQTTVGRASYSSFPVVLFGFLWLLTALFSVVAAPTLRGIRCGEGALAHPGLLLTRILFLILIGIFWAGLVSDQMPCFLGVPNCD